LTLPCNSGQTNRRSSGRKATTKLVPTEVTSRLGSFRASIRRVQKKKSRGLKFLRRCTLHGVVGEGASSDAELGQDPLSSPTAWGGGWGKKKGRSLRGDRVVVRAEATWRRSGQHHAQRVPDLDNRRKEKTHPLLGEWWRD